jgi:hypothetical protein
MARSPRASVPKTSGQGVSRLSYQKGYALKGVGATPKVSLTMGSTGDNNDRDYAKSKPPPKESVVENLLYGADEVAAIAKAKPEKSAVSLERKR